MLVVILFVDLFLDFLKYFFAYFANLGWVAELKLRSAYCDQDQLQHSEILKEYLF